MARKRDFPAKEAALSEIEKRRAELRVFQQKAAVTRENMLVARQEYLERLRVHGDSLGKCLGRIEEALARRPLPLPIWGLAVGILSFRILRRLTRKNKT
jgi:hypothetical protein